MSLTQEASAFVAAGRASPSAAAYTELLAVLPGMHAAAAKLLQLLLQVAGGVLVPQHKGVTRLLADLLRRLAADPPSFLTTSSWLVRREVCQQPLLMCLYTHVLSAFLSTVLKQAAETDCGEGCTQEEYG